MHWRYQLSWSTPVSLSMTEWVSCYEIQFTSPQNKVIVLSPTRCWTPGIHHSKMFGDLCYGGGNIWQVIWSLTLMKIKHHSDSSLHWISSHVIRSALLQFSLSRVFVCWSAALAFLVVHVHRHQRLWVCAQYKLTISASKLGIISSDQSGHNSNMILLDRMHECCDELWFH